jgi:hypothetical protein
MGRVKKAEDAVFIEGSRVRYGPTGRAKRIKTGGSQWSEEAEEQFLDVLASSANVRMAAAATGFTTPTAYWHRRRRPDFAARWSEALAQGYARLEILLVEAACRTMEGVDEAGVSTSLDISGQDEKLFAAMTVDQAMQVLRAHRNEVRGDGRRGPGRYAARRPFEEIRGSVVKKIMAIEAARDLPKPE